MELSSSESDLSSNDNIDDLYVRLASPDDSGSSSSSHISWDETDLETDSLPSHASSNSSLFEFIDE